MEPRNEGVRKEQGKEASPRERMLLTRLAKMEALWSKWCSRGEYVLGLNVPEELKKAFNEKKDDLEYELDLERKGFNQEKIAASLAELEQI